MAIIAPFHALRYDPKAVPTDKVVTQPYDKITPAMQERYYAASPYNLVRIILGLKEPGDNEETNVYSRAEGFLREWRGTGVLKQDAEASLYRYEQTFSLGGVTGSAVADAEYTRTGFIALLRLEDYENKVVYRHEQTLSKPKADRLNLLRATRTHFGQIFMLYEGDGKPLLDGSEEPAAEVRDEYGVEHRLWQVSDRERVGRVVEEMAGKRLIIADGHHRYETALAYRNEQRAAAVAAGGSSTQAAVPHEYVMATFVDMNAPGLVVLPTHRVVRGLEKFEAGEFVARARAKFMVQDVSKMMPRVNGTGPHFDVEIARQLLRCELRGNSVLPEERRPSAGDVIMLAVTASSTFLLYSKPGWVDDVLSHVPRLERQLDVVQLHKIILENVLGLSESAIREQRNIAYARDASEAVKEVTEGANVAFLMNPVRMDQVRDIAFGGGVLPQKSTDFYPKLLSGLTGYALD